MALYQPLVNTAWPKENWVSAGEPTHDQDDAYEKLRAELNKRYPGQWRDNGQFLHAKGTPGDLVLGKVDELLTKKEAEQRKRIQEALRDLRRVLDTLEDIYFG